MNPLVISGPSCLPGGKACGQASVMLHWDDDSPLRRALTGYVQGRRVGAGDAPGAPEACPQSAVTSNGRMVGGEGHLEVMVIMVMVSG